MKTLMTATALCAILTSTGWAGSARVEAQTRAQAALRGSAHGAADTLVLAQSRTRADVVAALQAAGYTVTEVRSTLLGRVRIIARNAEHSREVIMSRATGEILSDRIVEVFASGKARVGGGALAEVEAGGVGVGVDTDIDGSVDVDADVDVGVDVEVGGSGGVSLGLGD